MYHVPERRWQQLTSDADEINPIWSPNGDRLAFSSDRDGPFNLYVLRPDGESRAERLTHAPNWQLPYSWSPDGRFLAYQEQEGNSWNTWILPLDGDRKLWRWGPQGKNVTVPAFSPDGRWVAYQSQETGENFEVHVRPFPGPGSRQTVSGPDGGCGPVWSQDGREIMYLAGADSDNRILAVDVSPGPPLRFTNPHVAFAFPFAPVSAATVVRLRVFALAPDGRRLVTVRPDPRPAGEIHSLTLIRNWAEEVKAKVPAPR